METLPLIFLLSAWTFVLGLTFWSYSRLMRTEKDEKLPPPGTSL